MRRTHTRRMRHTHTRPRSIGRSYTYRNTNPGPLAVLGVIAAVLTGFVAYVAIYIGFLALVVFAIVKILQYLGVL